MSEILFVDVNQDVVTLLRRTDEAQGKVGVVTGTEDALARVDVTPDAIDVVVLGTTIDDPVRLTQRLCTLHRDLAVLILSDPEHYEALTRAIRFSPFLNNLVFCESTEDLPRVVERFKGVISRKQKQQRHKNVLRAIQEQIPDASATSSPSRLYLDTLLDHVPIGIALIDQDGYILDWNRHASVIFGIHERQAISQSIADLFPASEQTRLQSLIPPDTNTKPTKTLQRRTSTGETQHIDVTAAQVMDHDQQLGALVIFHDSTDRVRAETVARELDRQKAVAAALSEQADELRQLNKQLEQRNRDLQDFAYIASHDLQEPLRKIRSFSDLFYQKYEDVLDQTGANYLLRIHNAANRMTNLIQDLLTFARLDAQAGSFERIDLNTVVNTVLSDLEVLIDDTGGTVEVESFPSIEADPVQIRQLFQNLIGNGLKFHRPGVPPVVRVTGRLEQGDDETALEGKDVCRLVVQDNGIGFEEQYVDRIFSPLQRLHGREAYPGTGMGLTICRRIVERHNGKITARSTPDEGSRFIVLLPVHQDT